LDICHASRPDNSWLSQQCQNIFKDDMFIQAKSMNIKKAKGIIEKIYKVISD